MPFAQVGSLVFNYEEYGSAKPTVVLIPGMRNGLFSVRPTALQLKEKCRVIVYDRTNCGASHVDFGGTQSEAHRWSDELESLLDYLEAWPIHLASYSLGGAVAALLAQKRPSDVRSLFIGWVTGGSFDKARLSRELYLDFIEAAEAGGMESVCKTPHFAKTIQENPDNLRKLMEQDAAEFIKSMRRWCEYFLRPSKLTPLLDSEINIRQPKLILAGDDDVHLTESALDLCRLMGDAIYLPPIINKREWKKFNHPSQIAEWRSQVVPQLYLNFLEQIAGP